MLAIISKTKQQETGFKMLQETLKKRIGGGGWIHSHLQVQPVELQS